MRGSDPDQSGVHDLGSGPSARAPWGREGRGGVGAFRAHLAESGHRRGLTGEFLAGQRG
ncbi:hypothetical protein [Streptomyces purpurascens]